MSSTYRIASLKFIIPHYTYDAIYFDHFPMPTFSKEELKEALIALESTMSKCEKVLPKLQSGTSQHTLLVRRIKALSIAVTLIENEQKH